MKGKCIVCKVAGLLVLVGAINWGLVGACGFNLVTALLGDASTAARVVYVLIGLSGLGGLVCCLRGGCPKCK